MLEAVFKAFDIKASTSAAIPFGSGLINHTWRIETEEGTFILQRVNEQVFKWPEAIVHNINLTGSYLHHHYPDYLFVMPVKSIYNEEIFFDKETGGYYRLCPFIENSHTIDVVQKPHQAYEAAKQFGKFSRLLSGFDAHQLKITLPNFHNLALRYQQFEEALNNGNLSRIRASQTLIQLVKENKDIVAAFEEIKTNPRFKLRATHHDTKISNVLFDDDEKGMCVIDLDTLMPGYFISDVGDMLRTYLSPFSEEEKDFSKVEIREEYFIAILHAYLGELEDELSDEEKKHFVYAGKFMIYMQALRFLTDHLNDDVYYGSKYEGQNFVRAGNQLMLLQKLMDKEERLCAFVSSFSAERVGAN
jgi:Ser/Thr protein kinase RdoA (MazF antagonist)